MYFISRLVYGLINNSSLNICLLKTILSVVFMDDKSGWWENKILFEKQRSISDEMPQIYSMSIKKPEL